MKLCKFMLVLSLFCGVFTTLSSTNGSYGLPLALIEQHHGDGLFNELEVCKHVRSRRRLCRHSVAGGAVLSGRRPLNCELLLKRGLFL